MEESKNTTAVAEVKPQTPGRSDQFTQKIMAEFSSNVSRAIELTEYQRFLIQGYFIKMDLALKAAEENRLAKNAMNSDPKFNNNLAYTWENVNLHDLALDIIYYARMGLDMMSANHLFPIPFKNNKIQKYGITLMPGYNGIRYVAQKYAQDAFTAATIELVYSNDTFKPIKKDGTNKIESYQFEIINPFDRGEIIGGFGYIEYEDPTKNKLIMMPIKDILKRKPKKAAPEFWGGEKDVWEKGKKTGTEQIEGWYEDMCRKTVIREVFSPKHIPRDPEKVDESYRHMKVQEARMAEMEAQAEIGEFANRTFIEGHVVDQVYDMTQGEGEADGVSGQISMEDQQPAKGTNPTTPPGANF